MASQAHSPLPDDPENIRHREEKEQAWMNHGEYGSDELIDIPNRQIELFGAWEWPTGTGTGGFEVSIGPKDELLELVVQPTWQGQVKASKPSTITEETAASDSSDKCSKPSSLASSVEDDKAKIEYGPNTVLMRMMTLGVSTKMSQGRMARLNEETR